jgi:hypothetical protein
MLLGEINAEIARVANIGPNRVGSSANSTRTEITLYLEERANPSPLLALLIGDCVNNLRGTLDHLVFHLPRAIGTPPKWEKDSMFPICETPADFANAQRRFAGISSAALQSLEGLQPYAQAGNPREHPLYHLQWLSNRDKHRLLNLAAFVPTKTGFYPPQPPSGTVHAAFNTGVLQTGDVIGKLYYSDPTPSGQTVKVSMDMGIVIVGLEPAMGVNAALERISDAVRNAVHDLSAFL